VDGYWIIEGMSVPRTKLSPMIRWFAGMTLVAWIGAHALCQTHCLIGACHDEQDDTSRNAVASVALHHGHEGHGSQPCGHDRDADSSCLTLKSALISNSIAPLITHQFSFRYTLASFALTFDAMAVEPVAPFSRQARLRDWLFTPEVCLGPAFRSHAPPSSSLT